MSSSRLPRALISLALASGATLAALAAPDLAAAAGGPTPTTVTFTSGGGVTQYWTVPLGVTSAQFTLWGAEGGVDVYNTNPAALGAKVTDTLTDLIGGETLQINVGGVGSVNTAGANGGGKGNGDAAGGGGATDVRIDPTGQYQLSSRVLVAGGGGGDAGVSSDAGASAGTPGSGGDSDSPGGNGIGFLTPYGVTFVGGSGGTAGATSGGTGGDAPTLTGTDSGNCSNDPSIPAIAFAEGAGSDGALGTGGAGAYGGGGGGGGYYGGGGGGGVDSDSCADEGGGSGGGGGSSYTPDGSGTVTDAVAAPADAPNGEVTVTFTAPASSTSTDLVSAAPTISFGHAVDLTATVAGSDGGGTMAFLDDGMPIAGCADVAPVSGSFTCSVTPNAAGVVAFWASYSGDANSLSSWSSVAEVDIVAIRPTAPTDVRAVGGVGTVTVTWRPPMSTGGDPITSYRLLFATLAGKEGSKPVVGLSNSTRSFTVHGLVSGRRYFFKLIAVNAKGAGPASMEASAIPKK